VAEPVVYKDAVFSIVDGFRKELTPRIRERLLKEAGVDEAAPKPSYPPSAQDATIKVFSEELFGKLSPDEATFELGRAAMKRYGDGPTKALFPLVRMLGPMKFLKRMPAMFRQTNNFAEVTADVTGPTSYELEHSHAGAYPNYLRGVLQGSGEIIGLKRYTCTVLKYDGQRARYRITWEP